MILNNFFLLSNAKTGPQGPPGKISEKPLINHSRFAERQIEKSSFPPTRQHEINFCFNLLRMIKNFKLKAKMKLISSLMINKILV